MDRTPRLEWAFGILGLALILGAIGFIGYQIVADEQRYADLRVELVRIEPQGGRHLVLLEISNEGGAAAENVRVTGRLHATGGTETREVTLDYVPSGSWRRAVLYFEADPASYRLKLGIDGYQEP